MRDKEWLCQDCGLFVAYKTMDSGTPYGCSSYDPPEPFPEQHWCKKCSEKEYKEALKAGVNMYNYWQKPDFQLKAMKKLGIIEKDFELVKQNNL